MANKQTNKARVGSEISLHNNGALRGRLVSDRVGHQLQVRPSCSLNCDYSINHSAAMFYLKLSSAVHFHFANLAIFRLKSQKATDGSVLHHKFAIQNTLVVFFVSYCYLL